MKDLNENNELNGQDEQTALPEDSSVITETSSGSAQSVSPETENGSAEKAAKKEKKKKSKPENGEEKTYKLPFLKNPVSKLTLIRIISISAAAVVAVIALVLGLVLGLRGSKPEYTVSFEACDHVEYSCGLLGESSVKSGEAVVKEGDTVRFTLSVEEGYTQEPRVTANDNELILADGAYSFTVKENVTVKVSEIFEIAPVLEGSGTQSSPWVLNNAREINYVAQNVNNGVPAYIQGYYVLGGDIDCNGIELNVIGNGRTQSSFFSGYFDGRGFTVSNYVMNPNGAQYAGFFGFVQTSGTGTDSLGTVTNLNLKDFTINAYAPDSTSVFAGALIGYSAGAQLINCSAVNGKLNIFGGTYFCYVGGALGALQSASATATDGSLFPFYAVANKVHTDVDISVGSGYVYGAGGIAGFVFSQHEMAQSIITNCYSEGDILGAIRAGGIAGFLGDYSSIANCYSSGELEAYTDAAGENTSADFAAYAGGIVAYAGLNTVISDSFSMAKTYASASNGSAYAHKGDLVAGKDEKTSTARELIIQNTEPLTSTPNSNYIRNTLGWRNCDWTVTDGALPQINTAVSAENTFTVKLDYSGYNVGEKTSDDVNVSVSATQVYYTPLSGYFNYTNPLFLRSYFSDDGKTSYGYFFDEELTKQVPYGYIPLRNTTLYIGFADYSAVAGTYYYNKNGRTVTLTLEKGGAYIQEDVKKFDSSYTFDGEKVIIYDALFARYSSVIEEDSPNLNYEQYHFVGVKTADGIKFYDGVYFKEENAIEFKTTNPAEQNLFVGTWEKSATINKKYEFKDDNTWTLKRGDTLLDSGSYSVDASKVATLKAGVTAKIDASGLLSVSNGTTEELFCYEDSLFGIWFDNTTGSYVNFNGFGSDLNGMALINLNNSALNLIYVYDGFFDVKDGDGKVLAKSVTLLNPENLSLYGYLTLANGTLSGIVYSTNLGGFVEAGNFRLVDDYTGEWIGDDNGAYKILNFNGLGIYKVENQSGTVVNLGYVEIDGVRYEYTVDVENELKGSFYIGNTKYNLEYNDVDRTVTVSNGTDTDVYGRKDIMYEYPLKDEDGNVYTFNGGGNLSTLGGKLTVTKTDGTTEDYNYKITSSTTDNNNNLTDVVIDIDNGGGSITVVNKKFIFKVGTEEGKTLWLDLPFSSNTPWAVSDTIYNFLINDFDLSYTATGRFMDMVDEATYVYNKSGGYVTVQYINETMTSFTTEYLILLDDGNIAISSYPYLVAGDYMYAALDDRMSGVWYDTLSRNHTLRFDGVADSKYTNGIAREYEGDTNVNIYFYTRRFGKIYIWQYDDESVMFVLEQVAWNATGENVYNNGGRSAFKLTEFDAEKTSVCSVKDGETEYEFYLDGSFTENGKQGSYELSEVNGSLITLVVHMAGEDDRTAEVDISSKTIRFIG